MTTTIMPHTRNPFPGLKPFEIEEQDYFFGREQQIDTMVDILAKNHFLSVVGTSGSGKSSLVNCGLIPALHQGLIGQAGSNWLIVKFRPGDRPIEAMAQALAAERALAETITPKVLTRVEIISSTLRLSTVGLLDIIEQSRLPESTRILLVVDQFEELFRYRQLSTPSQAVVAGFSEEAIAFVNLLLAVLAKNQAQIYISLTMRSDFLGDCTQFPGLAEIISRSLYLVPRMTREERRDAIVNPVLVEGATITPVLVTRLVNDVGDNPDQLSILQHALNRTWANWEVSGCSTSIDLEHYEAIGTMAKALDRHAEEAYHSLAKPGDNKDPSSLQFVCQSLFQAITDKANDERGIRRPTKLSTLSRITAASTTDLVAVIEVFRDPSRSFLMPPASKELDDDSVIDISHESLMRVWHRLSEWGDQEAIWAAEYQRLAERAQRYYAGDEGLLRDPALELALNRWEEIKPNQEWADRYHHGFAPARDYLKESEKARAEEIEEKEQADLMKLRIQHRNRNLFIAAFLGAVGLASYMFHQKQEALKQVARTWAAVSDGLIKEHEINPGMSIKLALAALNNEQLMDDPLESLKLANTLFTAMKKHGERSSDTSERITIPERILSVAELANRSLISAGANGSLHIWSQDLSALQKIVSKDAKLTNPVFLRLKNGRIVISGTLSNNTGASSDNKSNSRLQLWSKDMTQKLSETKLKDLAISIHEQPLSGTLLVAGYEHLDLYSPDLKLIRSKPLKTIRAVKVLRPHGDVLISLARDESQQSSRPYRLELWSADLMTRYRQINLGDEEDHAMDSLLQLKDSRLVSGSFDGSLQLWSSALERISSRVPAQARQILSLSTIRGDNDDEELVSGASDGTLRRFAIDKNGITPLHLPFPTEQGPVYSLLGVGPRLYSGGVDGSIKLWQWQRSRGNEHSQEDQIVRPDVSITTTLNGGSVYRVISRDGQDKQLDHGSFRNFHKKAAQTVMLGSKELNILSILPFQADPRQSLMVSGQRDGSVQLWRFESNKWIKKGPLFKPRGGKAGRITSIARLQDGDFVLGAKGFIYRVRFQDERWQEIGGACTLPTENSVASAKNILSMATLGNGDLVVGTNRGTIFRWKNPVNHWCKPPWQDELGEKQVFSLSEVSANSMIASMGDGSIVGWRWNPNVGWKWNTNSGPLLDRTEQFTLGTDSKIPILSSISYLAAQKIVIATNFNGGLQESAILQDISLKACRQVNASLNDDVRSGRSKPYIEQARQYCRKIMTS
jgi:WD40 repeat protein/energy-coupling factor transporter ATP-binding protein EcfA2